METLETSETLSLLDKSYKNLNVLMGSLLQVRFTVSIVFLAVTGLSLAQNLAGTYKSNGQTYAWTINGHQTLVWNKVPYLPLGLEIDGTPAAVDSAASAGIKDVVVDLPASGVGWSETIAELEKRHLTYLIRISSLARMARGISVDPASYRIANAKGVEHLDLPMPGATKALVLSAQKRDGSILKWSVTPVVDGRITYDLTVPPNLEAVILVFPWLSGLEQPDFWEGLDAHRDQLLETLKANPPGPGLRGIVNPIGKLLNLPNRNLRVVPDSAAFRSEFASFLEIKYRNVVGVMRAWSLPTSVISANETGEDPKEILSFEDVAGLVPLWAGNRGLGQLYDPKKKLLYSCDNAHCSFWSDMSEAVSIAESRRFQRLVQTIRKLDDVPVIQEWAGWAIPYEGKSPSVDGVGMKASAEGSVSLLEAASRATSSDLRWESPGWLPGTDIELGSTDPTKIAPITDDLISLGVRGIFYRASSVAALKEIAAQAASRATDISPSNYSPVPLFFPENATNPAHVQRLPGGSWWLPAPYDGERVDYGAGFNAYRMNTPKGSTLTIWADKPQRITFKMMNAKKLTASNIAGASPDPKLVKDGLEISVSETPMVISGLTELPVPMPAYNKTMTEIMYMVETSQKSHRDLTNATLQLVDARQGFERNPGGEFLNMRRLLHQIDAFLGRYTLQEAEGSDDTNFSEVKDAPGCSGGRTLELHPMIHCPTGYFAIYDIPVHTADDEEVWISAKIDPEIRPLVSVDITGQHFTLNDSPIGVYGSGFGWYHLGTTRNVIGTARCKILVNGNSPNVDIDSILLAPPGFRPDGLTYPEIELGVKDRVKPQKPSGRKRGLQANSGG